MFPSGQGVHDTGTPIPPGWYAQGGQGVHPVPLPSVPGAQTETKKPNQELYSSLCLQNITSGITAQFRFTALLLW